MEIAAREPRDRPARWPVRLCGALCLLLAAGAYLALDILAAVSLAPGAVALASLASVPGALLLGHRLPRRARLGLLALMLALPLGVPAIDWDTRKPFLRAFNAIEVGMAVEEADRLMAPFLREPPVGGASADGSIAYRHTIAGWGDADVGLVYVVDGIVRGSRFYRD